MKKKDIIFGIGYILLGILIDQLIKIIIRVKMNTGDSFSIIKGFFYISHVENTGAAWGGFSGYTIILTIVSIIILGFFIYMFRNIDFKKKIIFSISLVMVISGTVGNLIDRLIFRSVTDYLDFVIFGYDFPVFNFADMLLVVGFAFFIFDMVILSKDDEEKPKLVEEIKDENAMQNIESSSEENNENTENKEEL